MAKRKVFSIGNALTQGLEETIDSARVYSGELQIDLVPVHKIGLDPENPRELLITFEDIKQGPVATDPQYQKKIAEIESLRSMAASIKNQGIINPVTVYRQGDSYHLIAGERRTLASLLAGKTEIQARILSEKPDALKISQLQWIENMERSDLSLWEKIRNLYKLVAALQSQHNMPAHSITVTRLSELIGCSKPHAMHYKAVMEADETLLALIRQDKIRNLEKAALIAGIDDAVLRHEIATAAVDGYSLSALKALLRQKQTGAAKILSGRKGPVPETIRLGSTRNMKVARIIVESLLSNTALKHITADFQQIDLTDPRRVSGIFQQLMRKLEEIHA